VEVRLEHLLVVDVLFDQLAALRDDGKCNVILSLFLEQSALISLTVSHQRLPHNRPHKLALVMSREERDGQGAEEGVGGFGDGVWETSQMVEVELLVELLELSLHWLTYCDSE
jgi:hypothetical protein